MLPKFNFYSAYPQYNHMHAPKYFDWVKDGSGVIDFFSDDYIRIHKNFQSDRPRIAMLIEPRTIQPTVLLPEIIREYSGRSNAEDAAGGSESIGVQQPEHGHGSRILQ